MSLRDQKIENQIVEVADYEYLHYSLKMESSSSQSRTEIPGINPTARFLWLSESAEILGKASGLYVLWKNSLGHIQERRLSKAEAAVLDRLCEDLVLILSELSLTEAGTLSQLCQEQIAFVPLRAVEPSS